MVKIFSYTDPVTGRSSGRLLRKPILAMPAYKWKEPFNQNSTNGAYEKNLGDPELAGENAWKFLTIRTDYDIAPSETTKGNSVGYTYVTVTRPGAGKATFEYYVPGSYGENVVGSWTATVNRFARPAITPVPHLGLMSAGGQWQFPHAPNPDIDYERGLIWRKSDYNEAGRLIRKSETTYQYVSKGSAPAIIWGLRFDRLALAEDRNEARRIYLFGKYFLLTETDRVPKKEIVTTYDANDVTQTKNVTEATRYWYDSTSHKMLVQVDHTLTDGTIRSTKFRYPSDFSDHATGAEDAVTRLSFLRSNNRYNKPVETISTSKKAGDDERVMGASLIKFGSFGMTNAYPESIWMFTPQKAVRIDSFKTSTVALIGGVYKLDIDPRYEKKTVFTQYNTAGQLISTTDVVGRKQSVTRYSSSSTLPVLQISNAASDEVAFADFDNTTGVDFVSAGVSYNAPGRNGVAYYPGVALQRTVTKASGNTYVLSFWLKSNVTVDFSVWLKSADGTTTYETISWPVSSSGGSEFKYVQKVVPVTAVTTSQFQIIVQATSIPVPPTGGPESLPVIDDVFFFPDHAVMTGLAYHLPFGVSTVTTGAGDASHTNYDNLGRVRYVMDRQGNIVKRNSYHFSSDADKLVASFSIMPDIVIGQETTFSAYANDCLTGVSYHWNNDGAGFVQGTENFIASYGVGGEHTVTLKVTHPLHGERTVSRKIWVNPVPSSVEICAKGVATFSAGSSTVTSLHSCSNITATPPAYGVIFKVASTVCAGECTYTWKMKEYSGFSWVIVGSGMQFTFDKVTSSTKSFEVVCEVRSENGAVATSNPIGVLVDP